MPGPTQVWDYPGVFIAWGLMNGQFTASELVERAYEAGFRWFALEVPQEEGGVTLEAQVVSLRQELRKRQGCYFGLWQNPETSVSLGWVRSFVPNFYIFNVETDKAHARAVVMLEEYRKIRPGLPTAVITNFGGIEGVREAKVYLDHRVSCIPEAYMHSNPQATPEAVEWEATWRGWKPGLLSWWCRVAPCLEVYDTFRASSYVKHLPTFGHRFSVWSAEKMQPVDYQVLRR